MPGLSELSTGTYHPVLGFIGGSSGAQVQDVKQPIAMANDTAPKAMGVLGHASILWWFGILATLIIYRILYEIAEE
jgi:cellobiose-specific phosphotransferase system component IIC